ncbi:nuclear transport factor 2 family protein [Undibacterium terreum]|uniref:Ketosteroid isomerase-related protein n=1 Tax=Undibacterium terreum TaxID=1224302 RepID=A0A916UBY8_9BURK|nr:nuclear transport factor 2 family protein [Undibacterium terreum]GGC66641.1 hypothetical protein GCM10011396_12140 [Undibacterium terreum]
MVNISGTTEASKAVVRQFYVCAVQKDLARMEKLLHPDFTCGAPDYLPWGGTTITVEEYLKVTLPQVARVLDFSRFSFASLVAEGEDVVALINVGVMGTSAMLKISEHFVIKDGKAKSIWVAYYEPKALTELIALNARLDQAA